MGQMLRIIYRGFWDVPRMIFIRYNDKLYLFDSEFDDAIDDYSPFYKVYLMPDFNSEHLIDLRSWENIHLKAIRKLGQVPVVSVKFDASLRKEIDAVIFDDFSLIK